jgi:hypothetical protein
MKRLMIMLVLDMGRHTKNVHSQIAEDATRNRKPAVGDGVTMNYLSDRTVGTVVEVENDKQGEPKRIVVQTDDVRASGKGEGHQDWEIKPDPKGPKTAFTKRKDGRWVREGESLRSGLGCSIGMRDYYYDWNF